MMILFSYEAEAWVGVHCDGKKYQAKQVVPFSKGDKNPYLQNNEFRINLIYEVVAFEGEIDWVKENFDNIPIQKNKAKCHWFGDIAKMIAAAYIEETQA